MSFTGCLKNFEFSVLLAVLAFRHFECTLPTYLSATLCTYEPARSFQSSTKRLLKSPRVNLTSTGERPFILLLRLFGIRFQTASVLNIHVHSLPQFKKQLKTHLFRQAFLDSRM